MHGILNLSHTEYVPILSISSHKLLKVLEIQVILSHSLLNKSPLPRTPVYILFLQLLSIAFLTLFNKLESVYIILLEWLLGSQLKGLEPSPLRAIGIS